MLPTHRHSGAARKRSARAGPGRNPGHFDALVRVRWCSIGAAAMPASSTPVRQVDWVPAWSRDRPAGARGAGMTGGARRRRLDMTTGALSPNSPCAK